MRPSRLVPPLLAALALLLLLGCPSDDDDSAPVGDDDDATLDDDDDDSATDDDDSAIDDDDSADDDDDSSTVDPIHVEHDEGCDDLVPQLCILPWPSDAFLEVDGDTTTGFHVEYTPEAVPKVEAAPPLDPEPFRRLDGHSPAAQLMTMFAAAPDLADVAGPETIARSLQDDSPTVLIDLVTGDPVAHWVELDVQADDPAATVVYLRPADRLEEDRSYGVAFRDLVDGDGDALPSSEAFAALRDAVPTDNAWLEERRGRYEELFEGLEDAGLDRGTLQLAWTFHTASGDALRGDMLAIREDALVRLGADGIGCTITAVDQDYADDAYRRILGTITTPSYMDSPTPPAHFVRDGDEVPAFVENREIPFTALIPLSVGAPDGPIVPRPLVSFGHGLLGEAEGTLSHWRARTLANEAAMVVVATDWAGMSSGDVLTLAAAMANPNGFSAVTDRMQQGMVNFIALSRTVAGVCREEPAFVVDGQPVIDPAEQYYVGGSQGGILGGTLTVIHPDIDRGLLVVNGAAFSLMMDRSSAFSGLLDVFADFYPVRTDRAILLTLAQAMWDFAEPTSYLPFAEAGLPGIGPKTLLSIAALHDAQVPNLSTDLAMRMAGTPVISGSVREPWGFDVETAPWAGSGYVTIDVGDPVPPAGNVAPTVDAGGHDNVILTDAAIVMMLSFLQPGGVIPMPCDGICDPD
jgi:hypothetical protein